MTPGQIVRVLTDHGHGGLINSRERWTECLCEQRVSWLPHETGDEHDNSLREHIAEEIVKAANP